MLSSPMLNLMNLGIRFDRHSISFSHEPWPPRREVLGFHILVPLYSIYKLPSVGPDLYSPFVCVFQCSSLLCFNTMSAQLSANSSRGSNLVVVNKGRFTFLVDRTETKFSTSALASSV